MNNNGNKKTAAAAAGGQPATAVIAGDKKKRVRKAKKSKSSIQNPTVDATVWGAEASANGDGNDDVAMAEAGMGKRSPNTKVNASEMGSKSGSRVARRPAKRQKAKKKTQKENEKTRGSDTSESESGDAGTRSQASTRPSPKKRRRRRKTPTPPPAEDARALPQDEDVPPLMGPREDLSDDEDEPAAQRAPPRQTDAVREIMRKVVAKNSEIKYAQQNAHFAIYIYDSLDREELLEPWFIEQLDLIDKTTKQMKWAKTCMINSNAEDNNCPIILSNLTFEFFSDYLSTRKRRRGKKGRSRTKSLSMSSAVYEQCRSAITHLFQMSKYDVPEVFATKIKQFMAGLKRHVTERKVKEGDTDGDGKKKMSFKVYEKMCELFLRQEDEEFVFAHCFLTLEWNLMARSKNVVSAHVEHISWSNDALIFKFAKTKGDQTGLNVDQEWHVYATPNKPATCPVLALARYVFSNPGTLCTYGEENQGKLFPGDFQYYRFMKCFPQIIADNEMLFFNMGVGIGTLGLHSARKGACSWASAGTTVSPPMTPICLRACWSMGPVKEKYLHYKKAGDQYLG